MDIGHAKHRNDIVQRQSQSLAIERESDGLPERMQSVHVQEIGCDHGTLV